MAHSDRKSLWAVLHSNTHLSAGMTCSLMTFGVRGGFDAARHFPESIRLGIGIEHIHDIEADLDPPLHAARAMEHTSVSTGRL